MRQQSLIKLIDLHVCFRFVAEEKEREQKKLEKEERRRERHAAKEQRALEKAQVCGGVWDKVVGRLAGDVQVCGREKGWTRHVVKEQRVINNVLGTSDRTVACVVNVHRGSTKTIKTKDTGV